MKVQNTIVLLLIVLLSACAKKETELDFQKKAMTDIFSALMDSICVDSRILRNFPPKYGEIVYYKEGHYLRTDHAKYRIHI